MIDWTRMNELRDDVGADAMAELMALFVQEMDDAVAALRANAPPQSVAADLHFLRGAAANIGLVDVVAQCEAGEATARAGTPLPDGTIERLRTAYAAARDELVRTVPGVTRLTG